jgi:outer membrane protein OmpA-like peptidoglycan-associated protein
MIRSKELRIATFVALSFIVPAIFTVSASGEAIKMEGLITARTNTTITMRISDSQSLIVLLTPTTKVGQMAGVLKARRKKMSPAALVPGLSVQVEGNYNAANQLEAKSIAFKGNDLENAQAIQAGLEETQALAQQNQQNAEEAKKQLERQQMLVQQQQAALAAQQAALTVEQQKIAANKAAIAAANKRFGQLDDYNILDELTIYFGNGKVVVEGEYKPKLMQLAAKATTIDGYMIQVKSYASSSGSVALNQKLSEDRANNVVQILLQQGHVPLTSMLAPGAMGESRQIGSDNSAETERQNRRVVVRVLQNKGISGQ